jgi:DNA-binding transcriptional LysR family regulator
MPRKLDSDSQIGRRLRLRDLHLFFTVVQHGSMAKAASQLGISQPSVSEVIAELEHTLGARLFDRRPRGVELTMYGNALLARTRAVFDELRQGVKDIEFLSDPSGGEVRIGCAVGASVTFLRPIIHGFSTVFPGVILRIAEVTAYSGLHERKHDLILEWCVPPYSSEIVGSDVKVEFLFDDHLVVVAGPQSPWARRRKIDLADLAGERWILGPPNTANCVDVIDAFRTRGLDAPNIALESLSVPLRTYLVGNGQFIAAMARSVASQCPVKILPVEIAVRPWPFAIFTLKNRTLSPVVERFIAYLRKFAQSIPGNRQPRASEPRNNERQP